MASPLASTTRAAAPPTVTVTAPPRDWPRRVTVSPGNAASGSRAATLGVRFSLKPTGAERPPRVWTTTFTSWPEAASGTSGTVTVRPVALPPMTWAVASPKRTVFLAASSAKYCPEREMTCPGSPAAGCTDCRTGARPSTSLIATKPRSTSTSPPTGTSTLGLRQSMSRTASSAASQGGGVGGREGRLGCALAGFGKGAATGFAGSAGGASGAGGGSATMTVPGGIRTRSFGRFSFEPEATNAMRSPSDRGPVTTGSPFTKVPPMLPLSVIEIPASSQLMRRWAEPICSPTSCRLARRPDPTRIDVPSVRAKIAPSVGPPFTMRDGTSMTGPLRSLSTAPRQCCCCGAYLTVGRPVKDGRHARDGDGTRRGRGRAGRGWRRESARPHSARRRGSRWRRRPRPIGRLETSRRGRPPRRTRARSSLRSSSYWSPTKRTSALAERRFLS